MIDREQFHFFFFFLVSLPFLLIADERIFCTNCLQVDMVCARCFCCIIYREINLNITNCYYSHQYITLFNDNINYDQLILLICVFEPKAHDYETQKYKFTLMLYVRSVPDIGNMNIMYLYKFMPLPGGDPLSAQLPS